MTLHHRTTAALAAVGLGLALAACGASTELAAEPAGGAPTGTADAAPAAQNNQADTEFAQMMVIHHEGAIEMADLAVQQAATEEVRALAKRIADAQGPEIAMMTGWLGSWGEAMPHDAGMADMGHEGVDMGGMSQEEAMEELRGLSGTDVDRRFLELMIEHHRGAIEMARTHHDDGADADALALSEKIVRDQEAEIAEMEDLLREL
jgi:uncharacterized protein (DUF305 family)